MQDRGQDTLDLVDPAKYRLGEATNWDYRHFVFGTLSLETFLLLSREYSTV